MKKGKMIHLGHNRQKANRREEWRKLVFALFAMRDNKD